MSDCCCQKKHDYSCGGEMKNQNRDSCEKEGCGSHKKECVCENKDCGSQNESVSADIKEQSCGTQDRQCCCKNDSVEHDRGILVASASFEDEDITILPRPPILERLVCVEKGLDELAQKTASEKNMTLEEYYSYLLHLMLSSKHTMEQDGVGEGYREMASLYEKL